MFSSFPERRRKGWCERRCSVCCSLRPGIGSGSSARVSLGTACVERLGGWCLVRGCASSFVPDPSWPAPGGSFPAIPHVSLMLRSPSASHVPARASASTGSWAPFACPGRGKGCPAPWTGNLLYIPGGLLGTGPDQRLGCGGLRAFCQFSPVWSCRLFCVA